LGKKGGLWLGKGRQTQNESKKKMEKTGVKHVWGLHRGGDLGLSSGNDRVIGKVKGEEKTCHPERNAEPVCECSFISKKKTHLLIRSK